VNPKEVTAGGFARVAFRVPNESDDASTTKLEVHLPENAPIASVSTMPVAGWTVATTKRKLDKPIDMHGSQVNEAVSVITWTASSADVAVKPGQFQEFGVSLGPIPSDAKQLVFKALQTYSDGAVVRWIDEPKKGAELEHPAPVLNVIAPVAVVSPKSPSLASGENSNGGNNIVGWVALGAALLALFLAGFALVRSRRLPS
ncbi:MAG TPA: YcnI family protein, partial [Candidatus Limnocylindrales bacterium]|nr:YcnI family protein [Candidatus Limnocylindrales bacterium]